MEALYLKSQGVANEAILRLCAISKATYHRYLKEYLAGGIEKLRETRFHRPVSELQAHRAKLKAYFREHPPASSAEASAKIKELTGIERQPTQVRQFLKSLGLRPLKVGMIPAQADVAAQEQFKKKVWSPG
jgi:transposase